MLGELPTSATSHVVLATDLHAGNVLRAQREPWLAIDPKPFVGDPAYDATQHLLNCRARLVADPLRVIGRFAEHLGVDPDRVRLWMFARLAADPRDDWYDGSLELARRLLP
jgi:streptomycin 6-kinase